MKVDWPMIERSVPLKRNLVPVAAVKSFQKMTVEMPRMTPGVSTGETTIR